MRLKEQLGIEDDRGVDMIAKEAYTILKRKHVKLKAIRCVEYPSVFVFQVVPISFDTNEQTDKMLGNAMSVNKKTKEVRDFKPFNIPISEFKAGREVKNFQ